MKPFFGKYDDLAMVTIGICGIAFFLWLAI
jgi:hypothetical protein